MNSPQDQKPSSVGAPSHSPVLNPAKKQGKKGRTSSSPQGPQSLQEIKKRGHRARQAPESDLCEKLAGLSLASEPAVGGTGLVYDERMLAPHCLWDDGFPECPSRLAAVTEKLTECGLTERCVLVPAREASEEEILLVHSPQYVELMKTTQSMNTEELKTLSQQYDSVYLHPASYSACRVAVGSVLQLVDRVLGSELRNGFAAVRPPGHHAHHDQMNGYCMFNQLAIAARYAQQQHGIKRVLIVDWDVHHGQGTQFLFEDDPSILYFSIHRYENGDFWPHLTESSSASVGKERGVRYNINVPWNKAGMSDGDYIAAFLHLLLPVSFEFQPHLVLVAAGFDSVAGDPKGEMAASPSCFAHLTHLLSSLAHGRLILSLEGGYNLRSLSDGTCACLKSLLGDPCPQLPSPLLPCSSALDSISDTILAHRKLWKVLQDLDVGESLDREKDAEVCGEVTVSVILDAALQQIMRQMPEHRTGLVYDERMMEHYNLWDSGHPETPQRISQIFQRHKEGGLLSRCTRLSTRPATQTELQMCHSPSHIQKMEASARMKPRDLHRLSSEYNSIYINTKSYSNACLAAGSAFSAVEAVHTGKVQNAVCIVRPPGHHAEPDSACGFCFFNTVALAARYAQSLRNPSEPPLRVMILDWDVHHGNGTQHIFEDDPSVLYVSLHRYDHALFFPCSADASHDKVGRGRGEGFNVNIPWNGGKMGDADYLMAFHRVVMPIAYEFDPQLVLVSAGFDAARGDPLGGCGVSPEGYAHMTHILMGLAGGRLVLVLEGGYNLTSISESMVMCTRTLLGDPPPLLDPRPPRLAALRSVHSVLAVHRRYWKSLRLNVTGSVSNSLSETNEDLLSPPKNSPAKGKSRKKPISSSPGPRPISGSPGPRPISGSPGPRPISGSPGPRPISDSLGPGPLPSSPGQHIPHVDCHHGETAPVGDVGGHDAVGQTTTLSHQVCVEEDQRGISGAEEQKTEFTGHGEMVLEQPPTSRDCMSIQTNVNKVTVPDPNQLQRDFLNDVETGEHTSLATEKQSLQCGGESPVQPLFKLKDLQLIDDRAGAAQDIDPGHGVRSGIQSHCNQTSQVERPVDPRSEAAGGCSTDTSYTLCQIYTDSLEDDSGPGFAVPLLWCPHLETVQPLPPDGMDIKQPCAVCRSDLENWVCLTCYQVLCGRYISRHMLQHHTSSGHSLTLSFSDLSVWCYHCDSYVHHPTLLLAKCAAYHAKYGEEMPRIVVLSLLGVAAGFPILIGCWVPDSHWLLGSWFSLAAGFPILTGCWVPDSHWLLGSWFSLAAGFLVLIGCWVPDSHWLLGSWFSLAAGFPILTGCWVPDSHWLLGSWFSLAAGFPILTGCWVPDSHWLLGSWFSLAAGFLVLIGCWVPDSHWLLGSWFSLAAGFPILTGCWVPDSHWLLGSRFSLAAGFLVLIGCWVPDSHWLLGSWFSLSAGFPILTGCWVPGSHWLLCSWFSLAAGFLVLIGCWVPDSHWLLGSRFSLAAGFLVLIGCWVPGSHWLLGSWFSLAAGFPILTGCWVPGSHWLLGSWFSLAAGFLVLIGCWVPGSHWLLGSRFSLAAGFPVLIGCWVPGSHWLWVLAELAFEGKGPRASMRSARGEWDVHPEIYNVCLGRGDKRETYVLLVHME
ncbi:protein deacetylase HDAC6 [Pelodytes ibericus]